MKISDLLDDLMDDSVEIAEDVASARSAEHIKEAVMQTIGTEKRRKSSARVVVIAAAIAAVLISTAAAVTWHLQLRPTEDGEVLTYDHPAGGVLEYSEVGAVLNVADEEDGAAVCYEILFCPGYLPGDPDAYERMMFHGSVRRAGEPFVPYLNAEERLAASGMTEAEALNWYDAVWYASGDSFLRIDIYSGALTNGTDFLLSGTVTLLESATIHSMEATFLTVDYAGTYLESLGVRNHILLYHEQYRCMIDIVGTYSLEELQTVAEALTLYQTAAEAVDYFDAAFTCIDGAVG